MPVASAVEAADVVLGAHLASHKDRPLVRWLGSASEAGDQPPLLALCGAVLAYGWWAGDRRAGRAGAGMLGSLLLATAAKSGLKHLVSRTRPHVLLDQGRYEVARHGPDKGPWQSFPSGHTAGSVAVACAAARVYPEARWALYGAAATIALVQVPRGAHYPVDVAAGALIGVAADPARHALWRGLKSVAGVAPDV